MLRSKAGKQAKTYIDVLFYLPGDDLVIRTLALSHSALSAELGASALTGKQLLNPKGTLDLPCVTPTAPFKRSQEILVRCHLGESPEPCTEEIPHLAGSLLHRYHTVNSPPLPTPTTTTPCPRTHRMMTNMTSELPTKPTTNTTE